MDSINDRDSNRCDTANSNIRAQISKKGDIDYTLTVCPEFGDEENIYLSDIDKIVGFTAKEEKYKELKGVSINVVFKDRDQKLEDQRDVIRN